MTNQHPLDVLEETVERTVKDMGTTEKNLLHAALGVGGEAGELQDLVKKIAIYGSHDLNDPKVRDSIAYELGDILWYVQLASNIVGISVEDIILMNKEKLKLRFPDKFTVEGTDVKADKLITGEIE